MAAPDRLVPGSIYLFRHGETEWSLSGQHTGTTDLPLLPEGEAAARHFWPRFAKTPVLTKGASQPGQKALAERLRGYAKGKLRSDVERVIGWSRG